MVLLVVHPINTKAHPTIPPGWRWAVMAGDGPLDDMSRCANAGWCPTDGEASLEGEMVAAAAVKTSRMFGLDVQFEMRRLDYDPIPRDGDVVTIGG